MATWNRVASGSTAGNIPMNVEIGIQSVTRTSNTNVKVVYGVRFAMATYTWTSNSVAAFCPKDSGNRYYAFNSGGGARHTSEGTWYYANTTGSTTTSETCPFTQNIKVSVTQTSASFSVGYGWDAYTPNQKDSSSITVSFPTGATAPTGCWCSASPATETSFILSGGYGSDGNATVTATGFQYKKDGTSTWVNCNSTPSGLEVNTKYYFRYYATNSQGTSYSDGSANATSYKYPYVVSFKTNPLKIGTTPIIEVYNPLGRICTAYIKKDTSTGTLLGSTEGFTSESADYDVPVDSSAMYNSIPNSKTGTMVCYLVCSEVSYTSPVVSGTYGIKDDNTEIPTFSDSDWSYSANLTDLTNNNQVIINGYSRIDFTINNPATSNYGASITGYNYKWGSKSRTDGYVIGGEGNILEVSAIDSRGLIKTTNKTLVSGTTYIPYNIPTLDYSTSYTHRTDGISNETKLTLRGNLSVIKFGNSGVNNAIYSAKYKVYNYETKKWSNEFTIPASNFTLNQNGVFTLNEFLIHANGSSGGFPVGKRYAIQVIIKDGRGLLGTFTSNNILITDGKIARDVYQDGNGDYHQGINGLANENYNNIIYGKENITDSLYINGDKKLDSTTINKDLYVGNTGKQLKNIKSNQELVDLIYPVGSIYLSINNTNPGTLFGGTWEQIKDRFLLACGDTYSNGSTGGNATHTHTTGNHTLTIDEMPSHSHDMDDAVYGNYKNRLGIRGDGGGGKNLIPTMTQTNGYSKYLPTNTGGGKPHSHGDTGSANHMPPYLAVYVWKRIA